MNIIIPLGGQGKRFSENGYTRPKPLIKVLGKEIIFWVLDSLNLKENDTVYIPYNNHLDAYSFRDVISTKYPTFKLLPIGFTNGAAETLKICLEYFSITEKFVILDGDTWYEEDILSIARKAPQNMTTYFNSTFPKPIFSYINIEGKKITEIKEKVKISDNANTGCYYFRDPKKVLEHISEIEKHEEVYISDIIKSMIVKGEVFEAEKITSFHVLGTPQQLIEFSNNFNVEPKRFVFDLDNTLVTYPSVAGDYTTVKPIDKTISYLKKLKKQGHYIIIYTARRMRTHQGNIAAVVADIGKITIDTLNKYNIPFDEIAFGKPYAHFYIDDLMTSPKTDLNKELGFYLESVQPRHFNKLIFSDNSVKKVSKDKKLEGEAFFYNEITKFKQKEYFPKLISKGYDFIEMEKIEGTNYSTLFINQILDPIHIDNLMSVIDEIHNIDSLGKFDSYYDYNEKLLKRFSEFDYSKYGVEDKDLNEVYENVKNIKGELKIISGDLVFSNIILCNTGNLKLIDVKGKLGEELSLYGDPFYDYSKIYQSMIGYDEILLEKEIDFSYKLNLIQHFESKFSKKDLCKIKKITKSLFYSLIPLHDEFHKQKKYLDLANSIVLSE